MPLSKIVILLKEAIGLDVDSIGLGSIDRVVKQRLVANGLKSMDDYLDLVLESPIEFQELLEAVVIPETWFFRHPDSFSALATLAAGYKRIRLLTVPCATGEEPYSIVIALLEAGFQRGQFRVDAIDISPRALALARAGVYGRNSFRGGTLEWRERYFDPSPAGFRLNEIVKSAVNFRAGNLLDETFLNGEEPYDFVFCRNLLIYFDIPTQDRAAKKLRQLLSPDGVLFVGPAEPGLFIQHDFVSAKLPMAFALRKHALPKPASIDRVPKRISRPVIPALKAGPKPVPVAKPLAPKKVAQPPKTDLETATRLADEGRLNDAAAICENLLREEGDSAPALYLLGLVRDVSGDKEEAGRYYRKALYLNPKHYEALMHLSFLNEKSGDRGAAALFKSRAQRAKGGVK